jgi:hypothetical protein
MEDFCPAAQLPSSVELQCESVMLVLDERMSRHGPTTARALNPVSDHADFKAVVRGRVWQDSLCRLTCLRGLCERGLWMFAFTSRADGRGLRSEMICWRLGEETCEPLAWSTADGGGGEASMHREELTMICLTQTGQHYIGANGRSVISPPIRCAGCFAHQAVSCAGDLAHGSPNSATNA